MYRMSEMRKHLQMMFTDVRQFLVTEGVRKLEIVQRNAKGDVTKEFDFQAEGRIIDYCAREIAEPVRILTEERGEVRSRAGSARWTLIVDPVDGSENFSRRNEFSCVSLALLPGEDLPRPDAVSAALVGRIFDGTVYEALKGLGAWRNGEPVRTSGATDLRHAIVAIDFFFQEEGAVSRLYPFLASIKDVRRFGTAAAEFAAVAYGGVDAYVDVRDTLTPENYMAAYLIVAEAGGVISDRFGRSLNPIHSMTQGQSIVAAATSALHAAILSTLDGHSA